MTKQHGPFQPGGLLIAAGDVAYEFVRDLGVGRRGERVVLARPRQKHRIGGWVVVKLLRPLDDAKARRRLAEEVELASYLDHPNIARVYSLIEHRAHLYAVSEFVEGYSLEEASSYPLLCKRFVSEAFALYVCAEVAAALQHAHTRMDTRGNPLAIVHRDINPRTIRLGALGEVKLTDFGLAASRLAGRVATSLPSVRGEAFFASPEQLLHRPVDHRSDLFSLGLVLLELLTGQHLFWLTDLDMREMASDMAALDAESFERFAASIEEREERDDAEEGKLQWEAQLALQARIFEPESVEQAAHELPEPTRAILHRLLRKNPDERFQTGAELEAALRARLAELSPRYEAEDAAREIFLAKAEAAGIALEQAHKAGGVPLGSVPVRNEDAISTSKA